MNSDKRRYATNGSQKRTESFQAYITKSEDKTIQDAMNFISRRDKHKYSKGEFLMWMFSEIFGDRDFTLSQLNSFENDSAEIRSAIDILESVLNKRQKFSKELRDYSENDKGDESDE